MNSSETLVKHYYENLGWTVLRCGWPDFLIHRSHPIYGKYGLLETKFVEVKRPPDDLSKEQVKLLDSLALTVGTPSVSVAWVDPITNDICPLDHMEGMASKAAQNALESVFTGYLTPQERSERTKAGMVKAAASGKKIGRPRRDFQLKEAIALRAQGKSLDEIAKLIGVPRSTVTRGLQEAAKNLHPENGQNDCSL